MKGQDILEGASLYNEILYYEILFQKSFIKRNPFCFLKYFFQTRFNEVLLQNISMIYSFFSLTKPKNMC